MTTETEDRRRPTWQRLVAILIGVVATMTLGDAIADQLGYPEGGWAGGLIGLLMFAGFTAVLWGAEAYVERHPRARPVARQVGPMLFSLALTTLLAWAWTRLG